MPYIQAVEYSCKIVSGKKSPRAIQFFFCFCFFLCCLWPAGKPVLKVLCYLCKVKTFIQSGIKYSCTLTFSPSKWRQCGRVVRACALRPPSDHSLNLFQVVPGSISWRIYKIANWFASRQLGFLTTVYVQCSEILATLKSEGKQSHY